MLYGERKENNKTNVPGGSRAVSKEDATPELSLEGGRGIFWVGNVDGQKRCHTEVAVIQRHGGEEVRPPLSQLPAMYFDRAWLLKMWSPGHLPSEFSRLSFFSVCLFI